MENPDNPAASRVVCLRAECAFRSRTDSEKYVCTNTCALCTLMQMQTENKNHDLRLTGNTPPPILM